MDLYDMVEILGALDLSQDGLDVGADDGADQQWLGGLGEFRFESFAEGKSEQKGGALVFEGLADEIGLWNRNLESFYYLDSVSWFEG